MADASQEVRQLINRMAERDPAAVRLGETLSLAARIEPWLLRAARLRLTPELDSSAEADLWHSSLVESRAPDWAVLAPKAAHELRRRLAADRERLWGARRLVVAAHRRMPPTLRLEEQLLWLSRREGAHAVGAMNRQLRRVLDKLAENSAAGVGIARWFASVAKRLPPDVFKTEAYSLLVFATSALLDGRHVGDPSARNLTDIEPLELSLPASTPKEQLWVALTSSGLALGPERSPGSVSLELPRTDPLLLEVTAGDWSPIIVTLRRGEAKTVPLGSNRLRLRTAGGDVLWLLPRSAPSRRDVQLGDVIRELKYGSAFILHDDFRVHNFIPTPGGVAGRWEDAFISLDRLAPADTGNIEP